LGLGEEDVVVEVDEVLGKPRNMVEPGFDGVGVEGGEVRGPADLLVGHQSDPLVIGSKPRRSVPCRHDVDVPDPAGVAPDGTKCETQLTIVPISGRVAGVGADVGGPDRHPPFELGSPRRIGPVHPREDDIDRDSDTAR
jgi:hypothetical protein